MKNEQIIVNNLKRLFLIFRSKEITFKKTQK